MSSQLAQQAAPPPAEDDQKVDRTREFMQRLMTGTPMLSVLAVVASLVLGAVLIAFTDERVAETAGYFFARPTDMLQALWDAVAGAYTAMFQGAIFNPNRISTAQQVFTPLSNTFYYAAPLIIAGLGVAVAFKVGLFNIGGRGQMLVGSAVAGWVGFAVELPPIIHVAVALLAGIGAGAIWGGIVGLLKARTGAHEVILTIMLNYVAYWAIVYALRTPELLRNPDNNNPITPGMLDTAILHPLPGFKVHAGFLIAIAVVVIYWWFIERSSLGFQFRAVGLNPDAAKMAGMNVGLITTLAMVFAGAFMGLAGGIQVTGQVTSGFTSHIDAGIGFDAITVALLGRSSPWGTLIAGILFGALKAGGYNMAAAEGVPIDLVLVLQSFIVLFIAAPALVKTVFFLPKGGRK